MRNGWHTSVNGDSYHYVDGKRHNDNGPAVIYKNGSKVWFKNGLCHREDYHTIEYTNGDKAWFYQGACLGTSWEGYSQEQFEAFKRFKAFH